MSAITGRFNQTTSGLLFSKVASIAIGCIRPHDRNDRDRWRLRSRRSNAKFERLCEPQVKSLRKDDAREGHWPGCKAKISAEWYCFVMRLASDQRL